MPISLWPDTGTGQAALAPAHLSLQFSHHAKQRLAERTGLSTDDVESLVRRGCVRSLQYFGSSDIQMLLAYDAMRHQFCVLVVGVSARTVITVLTYEQALKHGWASALTALQKQTLHALARASGEHLITFDRGSGGNILEASMKVYATFVALGDPSSKLSQEKVGRLSRDELHVHCSGIVAVRSEPKREEFVARARAFIAAAGPSCRLASLTLTDKSGFRHRLERLPGVATVDLEDLDRRARWSDLAIGTESCGVYSPLTYCIGAAAAMETHSCS